MKKNLVIDENLIRVFWNFLCLEDQERQARFNNLNKNAIDLCVRWYLNEIYENQNETLRYICPPKEFLSLFGSNFKDISDCIKNNGGFRDFSQTLYKDLIKSKSIRDNINNILYFIGLTSNNFENDINSLYYDKVINDTTLMNAIKQFVESKDETKIFIALNIEYFIRSKKILSEDKIKEIDKNFWVNLDWDLFFSYCTRWKDGYPCNAYKKIFEDENFINIFSEYILHNAQQNKERNILCCDYFGKRMRLHPWEPSIGKFIKHIFSK